MSRLIISIWVGEDERDGKTHARVSVDPTVTIPELLMAHAHLTGWTEVFLRLKDSPAAVSAFRRKVAETLITREIREITE